jgi:hypothetical protein
VKLALGIIIYVIAYQTLIQINDFRWFALVFALNFMAILLINGIQNKPSSFEE